MKINAETSFNDLATPFNFWSKLSSLPITFYGHKFFIDLLNGSMHANGNCRMLSLEIEVFFLSRNQSTLKSSWNVILLIYWMISLQMNKESEKRMRKKYKMSFLSICKDSICLVWSTMCCFESSSWASKSWHFAVSLSNPSDCVFIDLLRFKFLVWKVGLKRA